MYDARDIGAAWLQDNWTLTPRLTLNLGVRYDVSLGANGDRLGAQPPFGQAKDIHAETLNLAPRLGFGYSLGKDKTTVIRGGYGKFYSEPQDVWLHHTAISLQTVVPSTPNDGRPNFTADPYNGHVPTYDSILASGVPRDTTSILLDPKTAFTPYSHQASIGFQHQFGPDMGIEADYVFTGLSAACHAVGVPVCFLSRGGRARGAVRLELERFS